MIYTAAYFLISVRIYFTIIERKMEIIKRIKATKLRQTTDIMAK